MQGCHATEQGAHFTRAAHDRERVFRATSGSIATRAPKKAHFLAPMSILLHHSATGWM